MKNKSIVWMLAAMGLLGGCKDNAAVNKSESDNAVKTDTLLVLGSWHSSYRFNDYVRFLLVNKNGEMARTGDVYGKYKRGDVHDFTNVGDTVITATDKDGNMRIVRNLTMENKINAFSRQK